MKYLDEALLEYARSGIYPFHMPGHKRRKMPFASVCRSPADQSAGKPAKMNRIETNITEADGISQISELDITEIDGFDNLHHATGILKEAQQRAADLYGAEQSFYLVNGSTCGILAAICAAAPKRNRVLIARNCHKAVYHALFLQELTADYLYPVVTEQQILGQITPEQVDDALRSRPETSAVIITSPTYEGILSDVAGIAKIAHQYGVPLIVDAAHGAHLGFGGSFPESPVRQGADAVIMSLHKTLPSFTQTALLHICSRRVDAEQVKKYLSVFETSSPSYLFMAGMDACVRLLQQENRALFQNYRMMLECFYQKTADLQQLHVLTRGDLSCKEAYDWDDSKIVIFTNHPNYGGPWLHRQLLEQYHLQSEMVSAHYVLLMSSIMDEPEGFERLVQALLEIDARLAESSRQQIYNEKKNDIKLFTTAELYQKNEIKMPIHEAESATKQQILLSEAAGRISVDTIYLYPPGIPVLVPGEMITEELIKKICICQKKGLLVEGTEIISKGRINVVCL